MAIHAITGVMGSGKSFEAVSEKILPALKNENGRRIITNIEGLNYQLIADFVQKDLDYVEKHLISVSYERVGEPGFWHNPEHPNNVAQSLVRPGDLVVLDEVWRYFPGRIVIPVDAMTFFRMHRHYVSEDTGLSCDVVLINQALRGIHRDIVDIIELQFACRKLKVLGRAKSYQVSMIEGGTRKPSHSYTRNYNPKIFPLYSSYTAKNATESIDKRQSVFSRPFFKIVAVFVVLIIPVASYQVYHHFHNMGKTSNEIANSTTTDTKSPGVVSTSSAAPAAIGSTTNNEEWRLVAMYSVNSLPVVVLSDSKGRFRTLTAAAYTRGAANDVSVAVPPVAPGRAAPWTGSTPSYVAISPMSK